MSYMFRAVKETWYEAAHCFVEPKAVVALLHELAARVATACVEKNYGDSISVWFEDGKKVLNYIEKNGRFSTAGFQDSLEEQGAATEKADLVALIDTMKALAKTWRNAIGAHGELVFYVDAY